LNPPLGLLKGDDFAKGKNQGDVGMSTKPAKRQRKLPSVRNDNPPVPLLGVCPCPTFLLDTEG